MCCDECARLLKKRAPLSQIAADGAAPFKVFSDAEYRANAKGVIAHAIATGRAIVIRADGTPRVVIDTAGRTVHHQALKFNV